MNENFNNDFNEGDALEESQLAEGFEHGQFGEPENGFALPEGEQPKKTFSGGTLLVVIVVLLAAGGLWSMRTLATAMAGLPADADLEAIFEKIESLDSPGQEVVVDAGLSVETGSALINDRTEKQVPLQDVQRNPFALYFEIPEKEPVQTGASAKSGDNGPTIEEQRQTKIDTFESAAAKLRVQMIMGGDEPLANISGRVVRVGDTIFDERLEIELTVSEISPGVVIVVGRDETLDLTHEMVLRLFQNK